LNKVSVVYETESRLKMKYIREGAIFQNIRIIISYVMGTSNVYVV